MNYNHQQNTEDWRVKPNLASNRPPWQTNQTQNLYGQPVQAKRTNPSPSMNNVFPTPTNATTNQSANMNKVFPTPTDATTNQSGNMNKVFPPPTYNTQNTGPSMSNNQPHYNTAQISGGPMPNGGVRTNSGGIATTGNYNQPNSNQQQGNNSDGFLGLRSPNSPTILPNNNMHNQNAPFSNYPSQQNTGQGYVAHYANNQPMNTGPTHQQSENTNERVYYTTENQSRIKVIERTIYEDISSPGLKNPNAEIAKLKKELEVYKRMANSKNQAPANQNAKDIAMPNNFDYAKNTTKLMLEIEKLKAENRNLKK